MATLWTTTTESSVKLVAAVGNLGSAAADSVDLFGKGIATLSVKMDSLHRQVRTDARMQDKTIIVSAVYKAVTDHLNLIEAAYKANCPGREFDRAAAFDKMVEEYTAHATKA